MQTLTEIDCHSFLERFQHFDDAVLRAVEVVYPYAWFTRPPPPEPERKRLNLLVSGVDREADNGWCNVVLQLDDVQQWKIDEPHAGYHGVLSDGLKIRWFDGIVYLDFSTDVYDLGTPEAFRRTRRYAAAMRLTWHVQPYDR